MKKEINAKNSKYTKGLHTALSVFANVRMFSKSIWEKGIGVWVVVFMILSLVIGYFFPESVIRVFDNAGIIMGFVGMCLTAAMGLWVWKEKEEVRNFFLNSPPDLKNFTDIEVDKVQAMIIPVSRKEQPEWILYHLKPNRVKFLYTPKSHAVARELYEKFNSDVIGRKIDEVPEVRKDNVGREITPGWIKNAFDPEEVYNEVLAMLDQLISDGYSKDNIFVDTTGGTVPMSIGAFMAAEEMGVSTVYVVATKPNGKIEDPQKSEEGRAIYLVKHERDLG